jgi:hypothetical protein
MRLGLLGIAIALFLPQLFQNMLRQECDVIQIISWICVGIGLSIVGYILLKPLSKEIPPIEIAVKDSKVVWGMWFTGERVLAKKLPEKYTSIKKILLMEPNSEAFETNLEITKASRDETKNEILRLTQMAMKKELEVRWYSTYRGIGLTLCDPLDSDEPSSNQAWCVVQSLKGSAPRDERETYISKNTVNGRSYFQSMLQNFKETWENSRTPDPGEYVTHKTA